MRGLVPLFLLLGVGLGFGLGELFRSDDVPVGASDPFEKVDLWEPEATHEPVAKPPVVVIADSPQGRVIDAVAKLPAPDLGSRGPDITATVVSEDGSPFAGLQVRLRPTGVAADSREIEITEDTLDEYIRRRVSRHRYYEALEQSAVSDEAGRVRFAAPYRNGYRIETNAAKLGVVTETTVDGQSARGGVFPGQEIVVTVIRRPQLRVTVELPDGSTPEKATLRDDEWDTYRWTRAEGTIGLRPSSSTLQATTADGERSAAVPVPADPRQGVVLKVLPKRELAVTVAVPGDVAIKSLNVYLLAANAGSEPNTEELVGLGTVARASGSTSSCTFQDLSPGPYWVGAGVLAGHVDVAQAVVVEEGTQSVTLRLPSSSAAGAFSAIAYDITGALVGDVRWRLYADGDRHVDITTAVGKDGWTSFVSAENLDEWIDDPARALFLEARSRSNGVLRVPVNSRRVIAQFAAQGKLIAHVVGGEDLKVALVLRDRNGHRVHESAQKDGRHFSAAVGAYDLIASVDGDEIFREKVEVLPGSTAHTVRLPRLHQLSITGISGSYLMLFNHEGTGQRHASIEDGVASFAGLPPGRYTAMTDETLMEIEVAGDRSTTFEPVSMNALRFIIPEGTEIPGMVLKDGDFVIGADGNKFEGASSMQLVFAPLQEGAPIEFIVIREGKEIVVPLNETQSQQLLQKTMSEELRAVPAHW